MNNEILYNISELLIPLDMSTELNILVVSKLDTEPITLSRIILCFSKKKRYCVEPPNDNRGFSSICCTDIVMTTKQFTKGYTSYVI